MERQLSRLAVMDFRFLATLGMTVRRGWIVAGNPFPITLDGRGGLLALRQTQGEHVSPYPFVVSLSNHESPFDRLSACPLT